jgi:hypothetical protein
MHQIIHALRIQHQLIKGRETKNLHDERKSSNFLLKGRNKNYQITTISRGPLIYSQILTLTSQLSFGEHIILIFRKASGAKKFNVTHNHRTEVVYNSAVVIIHQI